MSPLQSRTFEAFHKKFIYPWDPILLWLRGALKTLAVIIISGSVFSFYSPRMGIFAAFTGFCIMMGRSMTHFGKRQRLMLGVIAGAGLFVLPATVAGQNAVIATITAFVLAFAAVYIGVFGRIWSIGGIWSLLPCLVALSLPGDWRFGAWRIGAVLFAGFVSYALCFWIFPLRPLVVVRRVLLILVNDMSDYLKEAAASYKEPNGAVAELHVINNRIRLTIGRYRRVLEALKLRTRGTRVVGEADLDSAAMLLVSLIAFFDSTVSLLQRRSDMRNSPLFPVIWPTLHKTASLVSRKFEAFRKAIKGKGAFPDTGMLLDVLEETEQKLMAIRLENRDMASTIDWIETFNAFYSLKHLVLEFCRAVAFARELDPSGELGPMALDMAGQDQ